MGEQSGNDKKKPPFKDTAWRALLQKVEAIYIAPHITTGLARSEDARESMTYRPSNNDKGKDKDIPDKDNKNRSSLTDGFNTRKERRKSIAKRSSSTKITPPAGNSSPLQHH